MCAVPSGKHLRLTAPPATRRGTPPGWSLCQNKRIISIGRGRSFGPAALVYQNKNKEKGWGGHRNVQRLLYFMVLTSEI